MFLYGVEGVDGCHSGNPAQHEAFHIQHSNNTKKVKKMATPTKSSTELAS